MTRPPIREEEPRKPRPPLDVWRVCGNPIAPGEGSGCTCTTGPNRWTAQRALHRLDSEKGGPVQLAPRKRESTRKSGG